MNVTENDHLTKD